MLATSAGQLATAVSNATLGLSKAVPAPGAASAAGSPVGTPATQPLKVAPDLAPPAPPPATPSKPLARSNVSLGGEEIVIATVRRVAVAHRFGTVKSVRKVMQP